MPAPADRRLPIEPVSVLLLLVVCYGLISVVSYTDYPRRSDEAPLDELERRGLAVWRSNNCQVCHQIYGYGGFLGPDLTNRVGDATSDDEIATLVTSGQGRMPAFDLAADDTEALVAYLRRMNRTGLSQPPPLAAGRTVPRLRHLSLLTAEWTARHGGELPPEVRRGAEVWSLSGCGTCHLAFEVGPSLAPDLAGRALDLSAAALAEVLDEGRGRMPSFPLPPAELEDLSALLRWVCSHRAELVELNKNMLQREEFSWLEIPWFEYL